MAFITNLNIVLSELSCGALTRHDEKKLRNGAKEHEDF